MARSVDEIMTEMVARKESMPELGVLTSKSATAIWRLILYVAAFGISVHERLWDSYRTEIEEEIKNMVPHGKLWYRNKVLGFMADCVLTEGTDEYDTSGMSEAEIEAAHVIKYAAVTESATTSKIYIKVAGEDGSGQRCPITLNEETQLKAYINEIKDAGVRIAVVNRHADEFTCQMSIYYNPNKDPQMVKTECEDVIQQFVENLPFNGVFTKMELAAKLSEVEGVEIVGQIEATATEVLTDLSSGTNRTIEDYDQPIAGYYALTNATLTMIAYTA